MESKPPKNLLRNMRELGKHPRDITNQKDGIQTTTDFKKNMASKKIMELRKNWHQG